MSFLSKLFGSKNDEPQNQSEHAVIVRFQYGNTDLSPLFALENELERAIKAAHVGEFNGNEVASDGSDGYLYMYGPDADALFAAVRSVLEASSLMQGAQVKLRYGSPEDGVEETNLVIGA